MLRGPAGTPLAVDVEIAPGKIPFTIVEVKAQKGEFIRCELVERCADGKGRCVVRVENTMTKPGVYADRLAVRTSSSLRPVMPIYVTGRIE